MKDQFLETQRNQIQWTLEQHVFELLGFTYTWTFFTKYAPQYYMICGWLNPWMWNHGYEDFRFLTVQRAGTPNPSFVQGTSYTALRLYLTIIYMAFTLY